MHLNHSYIFKLIPIKFISAKNKEIFGSKFTLPWQPMPNGQLPYYNSILEDCNIFSVKVYMSTTFNVKMTSICFPRMEKKKKMCNIKKSMLLRKTKPSHCLKFTLSIIFKANFLLTEKQMCILKTFTNIR